MTRGQYKGKRFKHNQDLVHRHDTGKAKTQKWTFEVYIPMYRMNPYTPVNASPETVIRIRHLFDDFQRTLEDLGCVVRSRLG